MTIKTFEFPSFEEWNKTRKYSQKIGDYTCAIETVAGWCNVNTKNDYEAVIANSDNPTNIHVKKIFNKCINDCDESDEKTLKEWYEAVIVELNDKWKAFILDTYFITDNF